MNRQACAGVHVTMALAVVVCLFAIVISVESSQRPRPASAMFIVLGDAREIPRLTSPAAGVTFDIDGDGNVEQVAWTEPNANVALLALDVDGDGRITSGRELIGSHLISEAANGPNALLRMFKTSGTAISGAVEQGHVRSDTALGRHESQRCQ